MRASLALLFLFFTQPAIAEVSVIRSENKVYLESPRCDEIRETVQSLNTWKAKVDGFASAVPLDFKVTNGVCSSRVDPFLPQLAADLVGLHSPTAGPNCWNLSMVLNGFKQSLMAAPVEENELYMNSAICHKRVNQAPEIGDIGIAKKDGLIAHSYAYISNKIRFEKSTASVEDGYEIVIDDGGYHNLALSCANANQSYCQGVSFGFYHCDKLNYDRSAEAQVLKHLDDLDRQLEAYTFKKKIISKVEVDSLIEDLIRIKSWSENSAVRDKSFLFQVLVARIDASLMQALITFNDFANPIILDLANKQLKKYQNSRDKE
jgi:hypothetical protein